MASANVTFITRLKRREVIESIEEKVIRLDLDRNEAEAILWYIRNAGLTYNEERSNRERVDLSEGSLAKAIVRVIDALSPVVTSERGS